MTLITIKLPEERVYSDSGLKELYICYDINIFSCKLKIVEYLNWYTKRLFEELRSSTYRMIKPDAYLNIRKIIDYIYQSEFTIYKLKMTRLRYEDAAKFYKEHKGKQFYDNLVRFMTSYLIGGMKIVGKDAVKILRN